MLDRRLLSLCFASEIEAGEALVLRLILKLVRAILQTVSLGSNCSPAIWREQTKIRKNPLPCERLYSKRKKSIQESL